MNFAHDSNNYFLSKKVNLGLDLQGGSYLLLEVDSLPVVKEKLQNKLLLLRKSLTKTNWVWPPLTVKQIKGKSVVFNGDDYEELTKQFGLFNTYTGSKKFHTLDMLIAKHPFFKFHSSARDNGLHTVPYYRTLSFEEKRKFSDIILDNSDDQNKWIDTIRELL